MICYSSVRSDGTAPKLAEPSNRTTGKSCGSARSATSSLTRPDPTTPALNPGTPTSTIPPAESFVRVEFRQRGEPNSGGTKRPSNGNSITADQSRHSRQNASGSPKRPRHVSSRTRSIIDRRATPVRRNEAPTPPTPGRQVRAGDLHLPNAIRFCDRKCHS